MSVAACAPATQVRFKGTVLTCTVLEVCDFSAESFDQEVQTHVAGSPDFFSAAPCVVSLEQLEGLDADFPVEELLRICTKNKLHVIGLRSGNAVVTALAQRAGLPSLPVITQKERSEPAAKAPVTEAAAEPAAIPQKTRVIRQPVRSGQQVVAPDGDLIVMAPVSAGAEILAAGNIHVYAPLRGRALAGVRGDTSARIFCQSLEAELVAISGCYRGIEQTQESGWKQAVVIELFADQLTINPLPALRGNT